MKDFDDLFETDYLKNEFLLSCFSKILFIDFIIATDLKTESPKKGSRKILFIDCKTSKTHIIN